jgi:Domain of unknown function DUF1828
MSIETRLSDIASLFTCTPGAPGRLTQHFSRIVTPFHLPDGQVLDFYYREEAQGHFFTDLGTTLQWLRGQWVEESLPASVRSLLPEICQAESVELRSGQLRIRVTQEAEIAGGLMRLVQTALRIADLRFALYLQRPATPAQGTEEG